MSTTNNWISVKDWLPDVTRRYLIHARGDVTEAVFHTGSCEWEACNSRKIVTAEHWQPLPAPPPKPDAFEEWVKANDAGTALNQRHVSVKTEWSGTYDVSVPVAHAIWDAAIASKGEP